MTNKSENQLATKGDLKEFRDDVKNYMGLLYEKFDDEVKIVAEQHVDINRNLTGIKST